MGQAADRTGQSAARGGTAGNPAVVLDGEGGLVANPADSTAWHNLAGADLIGVGGAAIVSETRPSTQVGYKECAGNGGETWDFDSSAPPAHQITPDSDLQTIIKAWPALSPEMRAGLVALVRAAGTRAG